MSCWNGQIQGLRFQASGSWIAHGDSDWSKPIHPIQQLHVSKPKLKPIHHIPINQYKRTSFPFRCLNHAIPCHGAMVHCEYLLSFYLCVGSSANLKISISTNIATLGIFQVTKIHHFASEYIAGATCKASRRGSCTAHTSSSAEDRWSCSRLWSFNS